MSTKMIPCWVCAQSGKVAVASATGSPTKPPGDVDYVCSDKHTTQASTQPGRDALASTPPLRMSGTVVAYDFAVVVRVGVDAALAGLTDVTLLPKVHPLINTVNITSQRQEEDGALLLTDFGVAETLPLFGIFPTTNRYTGQMRVRPSTPHVVDFVGWSVPNVHIVHRYTLTPWSGTDSNAAQPAPATLITQQVWLTAPLLLRGYVTRTAQAAHLHSLQRMTDHLQAINQSAATAASS